jgi:hypothetical protein
MFVAASDGDLGQQARLQQALTRDGEMPKVVSCCSHGVAFPWFYI